MKKILTAIFLFAFCIASAQNNTSGTLISSGDSVLFTDLKPVYTTKTPKFYSLVIDKIEYTKNEMIFYLGFISTNTDGVIEDIFGKKGQNGMCLITKKKIYYMNNIKNFRLNGTLYSELVPNDKYLQCKVNPGGKLTWEIYFPRLPNEIKTVNMVAKNDGNFTDSPSEAYFNIQIKYPVDNVDAKKEKDLLNKMELNKPLTLNNIYFETGKSNLLDSSFAELNTLFTILKSKPKMIIQISGYTDNVGKAQDNIVLSEARANAVKKYLSGNGIDSNRIIAKGYGSSNPKTSNDTEAGRAQNRRVEIMVVKNE